MRNNKGVTLTSLTIYIVVMVIILIALTFISSNFTFQVMDTTGRGKVANESIKLYSFLVSDVKAANKITEYSDNYIRFDNDAKYTIKYLNGLSDSDRQEKQYEIYRNGVLISENILDAYFDYDYEKNTLYLNIKYIYGKNIIEKEHVFQIGRGY